MTPEAAAGEFQSAGLCAFLVRIHYDAQVPLKTGTSGSTLRWALAIALGLVGLAINAFPLEVLSGVNLLLGHGAVVAAGVLGGPLAGAVAGAIAGSITPLLFGHPWVLPMLVVEGTGVGLLARRFSPLWAVALFWLLGAFPYFLVLRLVYPVGTSATIIAKTVVESGIGALVLEVLLLEPHLHRLLRPWLPKPVREVRTRSAVRSVVLLAALLPLVVMAILYARLLYRERVESLDRSNVALAESMADVFEGQLAEARTVLLQAAHDMEGGADPRRVLARPLFQSPLLREAALVRDGRVVTAVGVPRSDGISLEALPGLEPGEPVRKATLAGAGAPLYLIAAPIPGGEVVARVDPSPMLGFVTYTRPELSRLLILDGDRVVADTGAGPLDERLLGAIARATASMETTGAEMEADPGQGTASYLADPTAPRTLRPQVTNRVAVRPVEAYGLRVVVIRQQRIIQAALEGEALALLGALVIAMLVVFAAGHALTRLVVEPVQAVSRAASGLEEGRRTARVDPRAGEAPLELRQLAEGFDRMADRLEQQLGAVEAASRAKDEFLSVASHELKTPLTILKAQVQLLERRLPGDQVAQLRLIDRQLDRITRLVSQLLDASAVGAGVISLEPREFELSAVVRRVAEGLAPSSPHHDLRLDLEPVTGRWDELRLEQVLHNLIGNAIKFSPVGGVIDISLHRRDGDEAVVEIADRGIGLAGNDKAKLFQRFGRGTGSNIGGFGVGLYVVREIVQRHGGSVDLSPREGGGTVATVRLPLEAPAAGAGPGPA